MNNTITLPHLDYGQGSAGFGGKKKLTFKKVLQNIDNHAYSQLTSELNLQLSN